MPSLTFPLALLKLVGTLSPHRGHPLSAWLWCPRGLAFPGLMGLKQSKTLLGRTAPVERRTDLSPEPTARLPVARPGYARSFSRGAGYRHSTHLEALGLF